MDINAEARLIDLFICYWLLPLKEKNLFQTFLCFQQHDIKTSEMSSCLEVQNFGFNNSLKSLLS